MKKGTWPVSLMKQTAFLFHLLFLCLFLTGITFIYFNENYGRGLSWVQEESYADTMSFTEQLEDDVEMIFKYVKYKDLLELDGDLNYDADMVCVTFLSGRSVIYTLNDMLRYAKTRGYYLTDTFEVAGGPAVPEREMEDVAKPTIEWKAYDPNEVYREPSDQYSTLEDLSLQVLTLLGEYYQIQYNYIEHTSNLYFRVSYMDEYGQELLYTNAEGQTNDELRNLGRYLYISGDRIVMDTNLKYIPRNITSELETYNLYDNNDYYIILGVNTAYPNVDPYSTAHNEYEKIRVNFITGIILTALGALGFLFTFFVLVRLSGHRNSATPEIILLKLDHIPVECELALLFAILWLGGYFTSQYLEPLSHLFVSEGHWPYSTKLIHLVVRYFIFIGLGFSLLRNYKAGTLWTGSLLYRIFHRFVRLLDSCSFPMRLGLCFAGYLFGDGILLSAFLYLYQKREQSAVPYLYLLPGIIFFLFQVWTFLILFRNEVETEKISQGIEQMSSGDTSYKIDTDGFSGKVGQMAESLNNLNSGLETALQEKVKSERLKADLITNVSHDIKTPLTSIINYVDLLKREDIKDEKIQRYLEILEQKSQRLKTLTEDLVEASKASSGNLKLELARIDLVEMIYQANGEFEEKFQMRHLELVSELPDESVMISADGRRLWRVLENLYNNAFKYAMESSRIYVDVSVQEDKGVFTIKNVSAKPLNISPDELTERFVRGDVARTTEGSGLGLSIAKDLTHLQGGTFQVYIDGDLFKAQVGFPVMSEKHSFETEESS
ncbi:MAG: HAMP domain-containing histidine kinase [Hungatella sp.]|nr:HAMP domain-containing histidine kinase [Hungatella sp.]